MSHRLSNNKKRKLKSIIIQATQALISGDPARCEAYCRQADAIREGDAAVSNLRGTIAAKQGNLEKAKTFFQQAVAAAPRIADYRENLAHAFDALGQYSESAASYYQAMQCGASKLSSSLGYCAALFQLHDYHTVIQTLEKQVQRHPKHLDILIGLAVAYMNTRQFEKAERYLEKLFIIVPEHAEGNRQMGLLHAYNGNMDEAKLCFYKALATNPNNVPAYGNLAAVKQYTDPNDDDIAQLKILHQQHQVPQEHSALHFILGKIYDDLGDYDAAFSYFKQGNALRSQESPYDRKQEFAQLEAIMKAYQPDVLMNHSSLEDDTAIFIIGMPRCGSTLVEQIISSHAQVNAQGECNFLKGVALTNLHDKSNPLTVEKMANLSPEKLQQVGQDYLTALRGKNNDTCLRITDKSLKNFSLIGLIHCALPKAKIIHVSRHPLDTCLSIYKHDFPDQSLTMDDLGHFYRMYQRVMQHWRETLPEGVMYELNYEDIVQNQAAETRKLLDFCDLPWDDACLEFHKNRNKVDTSSIAQVRRPIYKDALATWQRYERHLQPLIKILGTQR